MKVHFGKTEVKMIPKNDCPMENRPKLKRKKNPNNPKEIAVYKKYYPKHQGNAYLTKNGFFMLSIINNFCNIFIIKIIKNSYIKITNITKIIKFRSFPTGRNFMSNISMFT